MARRARNQCFKRLACAKRYVASYRGGLLNMSMSINQIIFDLILRKDEKSIQELLNKGLATKEIVEEERKSYEKIYKENLSEVQ